MNVTTRDAVEKQTAVVFWVLYLAGIAISRLSTTTDRWISLTVAELFIGTIFLFALRAVTKNRLFTSVAIYEMLLFLVYGIAAYAHFNLSVLTPRGILWLLFGFIVLVAALVCTELFRRRLSQ